MSGSFMTHDSTECVCLRSHLDGQGGNDGLSMNQRWVAQVVQAIPVEDLCASLEPDCLTKLDSSILLEQLWGQDSKGTEHGLQYSQSLNFHDCQEIKIRNSWAR